MTDIRSFTGPHEFLSWDAPLPIRLSGQSLPEPITFPTITHALLAARTLDAQERAFIASIPDVPTARRTAQRLTLRPDYNEIKLDAARQILRLASKQHPTWAAKLTATSDAQLVYENDHNDRFWGIDRATGRGLNHHGRLTMDERSRLQTLTATPATSP
jgi:predicted NAD-dependent protein-ADP-ribosyltransferase YbiA (DUF1768 family)